MKTKFILCCLAGIAFNTVAIHGQTNPLNPGQDKPAEIIMESAKWSRDSEANVDAGLGGGWEIHHMNGTWRARHGGIFSDFFEAQDTNRMTQYTSLTRQIIATDKSIVLLHFENSDGYQNDTDGYGSIDIAQENGSLSGRGWGTWSKASDVKMTLHTGGKSKGGKKSQFILSGTATAELAKSPYYFGIPCWLISVDGNLLLNCVACTMYPDGEEIDVTPRAPAQMYGFTVGAEKIPCSEGSIEFADTNHWKVAKVEFDSDLAGGSGGEAGGGIAIQYTGVTVTYKAKVHVLCNCDCTSTWKNGTRVFTTSVSGPGDTIEIHKVGNTGDIIDIPDGIIDAIASILGDFSDLYGMDGTTAQFIAGEISSRTPQNPTDGEWEGGRSPCD